MIEPTDLILVALFAGVGNGLGTPIGQAIYRKFVHDHLNKLIGEKENDRQPDA